MKERVELREGETGNAVHLEEVSMGHVTETEGEEDGQRRGNMRITRERRRRKEGGGEGGIKYGGWGGWRGKNY